MSANFHGAGKDFPVIKEIVDVVYKSGKGNIDKERVGTVAYNRGVINGIIIAEAMRLAVEKFGMPLSGEKVRDGFRMVKLDKAV